MTHEDAGHYAAKHPDATIDATIAAAIEKRQSDARIACAAAHAIATQCGCAPQLVGVNIDLLEKRISHCQLGLFGHGGKKGKAVQAAADIAPELASAIRSARVDGRIACADAWTVADRLQLKRIDVACACEALGIKVGACQLGAF